MRKTGMLHPTDMSPVPPDTVGTIILAVASSAVAQDWPTGTHLALFSGTVDFYVAWASTGATVPTTNSAGTTASSGSAELNPGMRQVPGASTGYSIVGPTTGVVTASFWAK